MEKVSPNFVFYLSSDWETFHRPDMIRAFARQIKSGGGRLLIVDRMMCLLSGFMRGMKSSKGGPSRGFPKWKRSILRVLNRGNPIMQLDENLYLTQSIIGLDDRFARRFYLMPILNRLTLRRHVTTVMNHVGFDNRPLVTWFHHPFWEHYAGVLNERIKVYECFDQNLANPGVGAGGIERIVEAEKRLFAKMDLVITTSKRLLEEKKLFHNRVFCVHNGADVNFYSQIQDPSLNVNHKLAALPQPVVGYLGTINEHTDLELIQAIARMRPEWTILMVGKIDHCRVMRWESYKRLEMMPNVHIMGWIDRSQLLPICKAFNVCIIPYRRDSEFNRFVNPNKLHEYTAMGKPIVTYRGIDVESHRDLIWIVDTPEEFVRGIEEAWQSDSPERIEQRLCVARENSWDSRTRTMLEKVIEML